MDDYDTSQPQSTPRISCNTKVNDTIKYLNEKMLGLGWNFLGHTRNTFQKTEMGVEGFWVEKHKTYEVMNT